MQMEVAYMKRGTGASVKYSYLSVTTSILYSHFNFSRYSISKPYTACTMPLLRHYITKYRTHPIVLDSISVYRVAIAALRTYTLITLCSDTNYAYTSASALLLVHLFS